MKEKILIAIISLIVSVLFFIIIKKIKLNIKLKHNKKLSKKLIFLEVKIPQKIAIKQSDIDATDLIQTIKQNIQTMIQFFKNIYAIYENTNKFKKYWNNYISIEIFSEKEIIKFIIWVPYKYKEEIEKAVSSFYPWSVIDIIEEPKLLDEWKYIYWWEIELENEYFLPIKTYENSEKDPLDSILSTYSKLTIDEKLSLQILISPLWQKRSENIRKEIEQFKKWKKSLLKKIIKNIISKKNNESDNDKDKENEELKYKYSSTQIQDIDKKAETDLFLVKIKALAISTNKTRAKKIIETLWHSFSQYNNNWLNSFILKETKNINKFAKDFIERNFFTEWKIIWKDKENILNTNELISIIHFPHSRFNQNPRLSRQKYKIIPAPENIPNEWILIWHNEYWWIKKEIKLKFLDRFRHVYIIWQTWTWKSTLMKLLAIHDIMNWNWLCYIDPHWDDVDELLQYIPKDRIDDLIYFDLSNTEYPIWFNPLEADWEDEKDVITNDLVEMFISMYWPEVFWPRIQDYFRNACFLLMDQPDWWTLVEIMRLFTDSAFAEAKIRNIKNPVILSRWNQTYKKMWDREKAEIIPFIQAKFWPFTTWVYIRNIIWQPKSTFKMYDAMQEKKIILAKLSKWLSWEINSQLIWRILTMQIKLSALKRAKIPIEERTPFFLYIDEFQNYVSKSIESVLSEARKYRLWLTIAHQYIEQLKQSWLWWNLDLSTAIFGNVWTMFSLKIWAPDAEALEKEFCPPFSKEDLINMDKHKWIMKMSIDSQQSKPFSFKPKYYKSIPAINSEKKVDIIKQISSLKRWTKKELVEKEIYYRIWV